MASMDFGVLPLGAIRPDGSIPIVEVGRMPGERYVRNHDILRQWLVKEIITKSHLAAAEAFERDYRDALLSARYKSCLTALSGRGGHGDHMPKRYMEARKGYKAATQAMAMRGSAAIQAVVCEGDSLRTYADKTGQTVGEIKGMLLVALDVLVMVYRT